MFSGKLATLLVLALLTALAAGLPGSAAAAPVRQSAATNWTVLAGGDSPDMAYSTMGFYPAKLTINAGDSVTWVANSGDVHDVFFLAPGQQAPRPTLASDPATGMVEFNPQVAFPIGGPTYDGNGPAGSGTMGRQAPLVGKYTLTFTKPGTYNYVCSYHAPMMAGTITVQAAGSAPATTSDQALAAGKDQMAKDIADAQGMVAGIPAPGSSAGPNGTTTWNVGISAPLPMVDYMRYAPDQLTIHQGDTVVWTQRSLGTPHTVTLASGAAEPPLQIVKPQAGGPPQIFINPLSSNRQGGDVYDGTGFFNSGWIWGTKVPIPGPRTYALTFSQPGTYAFYCMLHDNMGQKGTITVLSAAGGGTPGMPTTGHGSDLWPLGLLALALALAGVRLRRVPQGV